jgi:hypothetical protein
VAGPSLCAETVPPWSSREELEQPVRCGGFESDAIISHDQHCLAGLTSQFDPYGPAGTGVFARIVE